MLRYLVLLVLVAGLLMYLLCNSKAQEVGRMMFFAALLALMYAAAPMAIALLR